MRHLCLRNEHACQACVDMPGVNCVSRPVPASPATASTPREQKLYSNCRAVLVMGTLTLPGESSGALHSPTAPGRLPAQRSDAPHVCMRE